MTAEYRGVVFKKNDKVKFVIPTDDRIIDPQTKNIIWRYGVLKFFTKNRKSCYILERGSEETIRISLFCVLPLN